MPTHDESRVHGGDSPGIEAVTTDRSDRPIQRDELTSLLSLCGTLAGLCIGIVAFINASSRGAATLIDDVLATCAATFLLCIYLITFAFRRYVATMAHCIRFCTTSTPVKQPPRETIRKG